MHTLVVDDNPTIRGILTDLLVDDGHDVTSARTGNEAIALLDQTPVPYDVILLDLAMPEGTGVDVAEFIQTRARARITKIVLVSAYAREFQTLYPESSLFDAFVSKPFTLDDVETAVETATGKECRCHPN